MRIDELTALDAVETIRTEWSSLALDSDHASPYVVPEFLLPWLRRLDDRYTLRFTTVRDGATLVGLAPMVDRRLSKLGVKLSLRSFPEAAPSPPCDILVHPEAHGVEEALMEHWLVQGGWDVIEFGRFPAGSRSIARIKALAGAAGLTTTQGNAESETYCVPISDTWLAYQARRSRNLRRSLTRGLRACEQVGATVFRHYPGDMGGEEAVTHVFSILARSWKNHEAGPRGWNAFLRDLIAELDRADALRLIFLVVAGRPIAYLLEVPFKGSVFAIHNAYDLEFQSFNAGQLLLANALERAHADGTVRYDFSGDKEYLGRWAEGTCSFDRVRLNSRSLTARLKLNVYDWIHRRRTQAVLENTDQVKDSLKRGSRAVATPDP